MSQNTYLFTSESVSEGHPDKIADQISDAILDAYLLQDPQAKVACECLITTGELIIAGEVKSLAKIDAVAIAKEVIANIGYTDLEYGFDAYTARITNLLHQQSPEINASVADGGAGDQGIMFGYACKETPEYMPLPITLAHRIVERQAQLRHSNPNGFLLPDAKSQVTVQYVNGKAVGIDTVVLSTQHLGSINQADLHAFCIENIILPVLNSYGFAEAKTYHINPSGSFTVGGPHGDTGLTGRKIIVDTYGGSAPHGGGAFSGKDPSKVDRSAAYIARCIAKHFVAADLFNECVIQLSYAIGVKEPVAIYIEGDSTTGISNEEIISRIRKTFDLTPNGIAQLLQLYRPIYFQTATYGHFGKADLPWEKLHTEIIEGLQVHRAIEAL